MLATAPGSSETERLYSIMSRSFQAGLAGTIAGILFVGVGGPIVMRINPDQAGAITDSENIGGDVTLGGTTTFITLGGVTTGFLIGIVRFLVGSRVPARPGARLPTGEIASAILGGLAGLGVTFGSRFSSRSTSDRTGEDSVASAAPWQRTVRYGGVIAFGAIGGLHLAGEVVGVL